MKDEWKKVFNEMHDAGYVIVAWTPEELGDVNGEWVEERVISYANEYLLQGETNGNYR